MHNNNYRMTLKTTAILLLSLISTLAFAYNEGLIGSQENLDSGITLTYLPESLLNPGNDYQISWEPTDVQVTLYYGYNPGNANPNNYQFSHVITPAQMSSPGTWNFDPVLLQTGLLFCMLQGTQQQTLTTIEFNLIVESDIAVAMGQPAILIYTTTPTFNWTPNENVNYYHLILSDSPFTIEEDSVTHEMTTTGANIIWQIITSESSIDYGQPDPSGFFTNINIPPLIGNLTTQNRPEYNWVVLNNYTGSPATSSDVVGALKGFEVEVEPPFASPILLEPADSSIINSETILFEWTSISGASNYHVYLTKKETTSDSTSNVFTPVWYVQSTVNATECPAANLLTAGNYRWKVIAENNQGEGSMSNMSDFVYSVESATANFYIKTNNNIPIQGVQIAFLPIEGPSLPSTLTDQSGFAQRLMPYGVYILELEKAGFITTETDEIVIDSPLTTNHTFYMTAASASAHGTVIDNLGNIITFASVTATNTTTNEETVSESNGNGYYSLDLEPGTYQFVASKTGYTSSPVRTITLQPEDNLDVDDFGGPLQVTVNLYSLDGYVLNNDNEPVSLANVECTNGIETYEYTTSNDGFYNIDVAPGTWTLTASKPAFWLSSSLDPITVINSGSTNNIILTPSANIISGVVYLGSVLANQDAVVRAVPFAGQIEETLVNEQGNYILSLATGEYQLNAYLDGYTSPPPINLSLGVGETIAGLNIVLTPNPSNITGKITSNGTQAVSGATVTSGNVTVTSNAQGNYTLNVPAGPHTVTASKTGYISASSPQVNVAVGQTLPNINLIISPNAATINGTVRSNGQAVFQANMTARKISTGAISTVQTAQNGTYSFGLSYGTYWIKATKSGMVAAAPESLQVVINPGQIVNGKDFNLLPNIGYISGSTVYNNLAVSNAQVNLVALGDPGITFNTQSNYYGTFNISATPGYQYKMTVSKTGYVSAIDTSETVTLNSTQDFTFNLEQLQSQLKGKVYAFPDTIIISDATVTAVNTVSGNTYTATTNSVGSYTLSMNAGSYDVTASKAGYLTVEQDTSLTPGQTIQNFKFYLEPNFAGLQGTVSRTSNQQPIANALVTVTEINTLTGASTQTDDYGLYSFTDLFQGSYNMTVTHSSYQTGQFNNIVLLGGATSTHNVSITALNGSIAGTVTDFYNQPVNGVTISAERMTGGIYTAQTGTNGAYTLSNLPSGNYGLTAAKAGYTVDELTGISLAPAQQLTGQDFQIIRNDGIIVGRVASTTGIGISDAAVSATDGLGNFGNATTTAAGYYTIDDLYTQAQFTVTAVKTGYTVFQAPGTVQPSPTNPDSANFIMLPNNLAISGTVKNQAGTVKGNIPIQAVSGGNILNATTNSNGYYNITNAAPQTTYTVKTNTYNQQLNNTQLDTAVAAVPLSNVNLTMQEHSSSLFGLVVDNTGSPMINVPVTARRIGGSIFSTNTGISGEWELGNLYAGNWKIYTSKLGYTVNPDTVSTNLNLGQALTVQDFIMTEILISISGTVRNQNSQPMDDVPVVAWSSVGTDTVYTNASGVYTFSDKTPNISFTISTILPEDEYENDTQNISTAYTNVTGIDLDVQVRNASVAGTIEDTDSNPLSGVNVNLVGLPPLEYDETIVTTNTNFNFSYLLNGSYEISFDKAGYLPYETSFNLSISENNNLGVITLQSVENGVYGTVTDGNTVTPLKHVVITVENLNTGETFNDTTSASGSYQVGGLNAVAPNNVYTVHFVKKGFPDEQSNNFQLTQSVQKNKTMTPYANSVYGSVKNSSGVHQADAVVSADKFGAAFYTDTTNYFGDYSFNPLSADNYQFHALKGNLDSYFENIAIPAGAAVIKDLTILNTAKMSGSVTYNGLSPPGAATVTLQNTVNQNIFTQQTGSGDSTFYFTGLRQNFYSASCNIEGFQVQNTPQTFTPTLGQTTNIDFTLISTENALNGFVLDSTGSDPVGGATVRLNRTGETDTLSDQTNNNGSFTFGNLQDGEYTVWTYKSGYVTTANSSATVNIGNNTAFEQILWLRSIPGSVSGTAYYVSSGQGLIDVAVRMRQTEGGVYDSTIYSGAEGTFLFAELESGTYELTAAKPNFTSQPESYLLPIAINQTVTGKDFYLSADIDSFLVHGYVTHGPDNIENAQVICRSLQTSSRKDTVFTDANGHYSFPDWPAPDQIQIKVAKAGYPALLSEPLDLSDSDLQRDFEYPAGQITFFVTSDGDIPLPNIQINILNQERGVDTTLTTDADGYAETNNLLQGNNLAPVPYLVSVSHYLPSVLSMQTFVDSLRNNELFADTIILGINYTTPDTMQIETPVEVYAEIANDLVNGAAGFDISLFYKGVGGNTYNELIMGPIVSAESITGVPPQALNPVAEASGSAGSKKSTVSELVDNPLSGGNPTLPPGAGTDQGFTTFVATIPGQSASGNVQFYLEAHYGDRTYSNSSQQASYSVTSIGALAILQLQPSSAELQWKMPQTVNLSTFDDALNPLNDSLTVSNIYWTFWDDADTTSTLGSLELVYSPTAIDSAALSAVYTATDTGRVNIMVLVAKGNVTLAQIATFDIVNKQLASITISDDIPTFKIFNTDSVTFTISALDINGTTMSIFPVWTTQPSNRGTITDISQTKAKFKPYPNIIGRIFFTVTDTLTGISGSYNVQSLNENDHGLSVKQKIVNSTSTTVYDSSGLKIEILPGTVVPESQVDIWLFRPVLPQVKKSSPNFEIHMDSYQLNKTGSFSAEVQNGTIPLYLTLPVPVETRRLNTAVGRWNIAMLQWDNLGGDLSADGTTITTALTDFSEYVVLGESKPLGVENLEYHPNPFSPNTYKKLQIEFTLNSKSDASPQVTIKIFNMRGDLVRTVLDRAQMPKGPHLYTTGVFQQGAENGSVEWDGLTNEGRMARNGRYLAYIKVEDPSGVKEKMDTIVLIK